MPTQVSIPPEQRAVATVGVQRIAGGQLHFDDDVLAAEEPLEIRISFVVEGRRVHRPLSVTMRTPGNDLELAIGFLFTEGLIRGYDDILRTHACRHGNVVRVHLRDDVVVDMARMERHFYTSSSCGVCGKTSIAAVRVAVERQAAPDQPRVSSHVIHQLPALLRSAQAVFEQTGGLHASALFNTSGELLCVREDVGRHNALDKLIGTQLPAHEAALSESVLLVSGRVSFELVQKAAVAGIPIVVAIGAPSSLAIRLAEEQGMTIVGFARHDRFNIYCGSERIV